MKITAMEPTCKLEKSILSAAGFLGDPTVQNLLKADLLWGEFKLEQSGSK